MATMATAAELLAAASGGDVTRAAGSPAALLRLIDALERSAAASARGRAVEETPPSTEPAPLRAAVAGGSPQLPGQVACLFRTQGQLDTLVALLLDRRFGGIERGALDTSSTAAHAAPAGTPTGGSGSGPDSSSQSGAVNTAAGSTDVVELALDRALELLKCLPPSTPLVTALARCASSTTRPVVRQQTFSYFFDWLKLWLTWADGAASTSPVADSASLFKGASWGDASEMAAMDSPLLESDLAGPCEFLSLKALIVTGLSDVWSAIRKACATRLYGVVHHLPLRRVEAMVSALVDLCIAPQFADKWRCKEGAFLGYAMLVKRFRRVSSSEAHALRRASDAGIGGGLPIAAANLGREATDAASVGPDLGRPVAIGVADSAAEEGPSKSPGVDADNAPVGSLPAFPDSPLLAKRSMSISQMDRYHHPGASAGHIGHVAPTRRPWVSLMPSVADDEAERHGPADGGSRREAVAAAESAAAPPPRPALPSSSPEPGVLSRTSSHGGESSTPQRKLSSGHHGLLRRALSDVGSRRGSERLGSSGQQATPPVPIPRALVLNGLEIEFAAPETTEDHFGDPTAQREPSLLAFGRHLFYHLPKFLAGPIRDVVYPLLAHEMLSVRENAIRLFTAFLLRSEPIEAVTSLKEVLNVLRGREARPVDPAYDGRASGAASRGRAPPPPPVPREDGRDGFRLPAATADELRPGGISDPFHAEGALGLIVVLVRLAPSSLLQASWGVVFPTLRQYLQHDASTVRQVASKAFLQIAAKGRDSGVVPLLATVLKSLVGSWAIVGPNSVREGVGGLDGLGMSVITEDNGSEDGEVASVRSDDPLAPATGADASLGVSDRDEEARAHLEAAAAAARKWGPLKWQGKEGYLLAYELILRFVVGNHQTALGDVASITPLQQARRNSSAAPPSRRGSRAGDSAAAAAAASALAAALAAETDPKPPSGTGKADSASTAGATGSVPGLAAPQAVTPVRKRSAATAPSPLAPSPFLSPAHIESPERRAGARHPHASHRSDVRHASSAPSEDGVSDRDSSAWNGINRRSGDADAEDSNPTGSLLYYLVQSCSAADAGSSHSQELPLATALRLLVVQTQECLGDNRFELRRMADQVLPLLTEFLLWADLAVLGSLWGGLPTYIAHRDARGCLMAASTLSLSLRRVRRLELNLRAVMNRNQHPHARSRATSLDGDEEGTDSADAGSTAARQLFSVNSIPGITPVEFDDDDLPVHPAGNAAVAAVQHLVRSVHEMLPSISPVLEALAAMAPSDKALVLACEILVILQSYYGLPGQVDSEAAASVGDGGEGGGPTYAFVWAQRTHMGVIINRVSRVMALAHAEDPALNVPPPQPTFLNRLQAAVRGHQLSPVRGGGSVSFFRARTAMGLAALPGSPLVVMTAGLASPLQQSVLVSPASGPASARSNSSTASPTRDILSPPRGGGATPPPAPAPAADAPDGQGDGTVGRIASFALPPVTSSATPARAVAGAAPGHGGQAVPQPSREQRAQLLEQSLVTALAPLLPTLIEHTTPGECAALLPYVLRWVEDSTDEGTKLRLLESLSSTRSLLTGMLGVPCGLVVRFVGAADADDGVDGGRVELVDVLEPSCWNDGSAGLSSTAAALTEALGAAAAAASTPRRASVGSAASLDASAASPGRATAHVVEVASAPYRTHRRVLSACALMVQRLCVLLCRREPAMETAVLKSMHSLLSDICLDTLSPALLKAVLVAVADRCFESAAASGAVAAHGAAGLGGSPPRPGKSSSRSGSRSPRPSAHGLRAVGSSGVMHTLSRHTMSSNSLSSQSMAIHLPHAMRTASRGSLGEHAGDQVLFGAAAGTALPSTNMAGSDPFSRGGGDSSSAVGSPTNSQHAAPTGPAPAVSGSEGAGAFVPATPPTTPPASPPLGVPAGRLDEHDSELSYPPSPANLTVVWRGKSGGVAAQHRQHTLAETGSSHRRAAGLSLVDEDMLEAVSLEQPTGLVRSNGTPGSGGRGSPRRPSGQSPQSPQSPAQDGSDGAAGRVVATPAAVGFSASRDTLKPVSEEVHVALPTEASVAVAGGAVAGGAHGSDYAGSGAGDAAVVAVECDDQGAAPGAAESADEGSDWDDWDDWDESDEGSEGSPDKVVAELGAFLDSLRERINARWLRRVSEVEEAAGSVAESSEAADDLFFDAILGLLPDSDKRVLNWVMEQRDDAE